VASFTYANLDTVEKLLAYRPKTIKTAVTAVSAATPALKTALHGLGDDEGIGDALRADIEDADAVIATLEQASISWAVRRLAGVFQSVNTSPDTSYLTFDSWFTAKKSGLTNPLLTNELVEAFRREFGVAAISAANASAPSATSYGTSTVSGATTITNSLTTTPVDTNLYAGGVLEAYVTTQVEGAANAATVFSLVGVDINGSVWTGAVSIADEAAAESVHLVVPTIAKTYPVKLTSVTVADGASGAVTWRIKEPRTIAAS